MTFQEYKAQETSRAGANRLSGFSVMVDQTEYDDALQASSAYANLSTSRIAPMAMRIPCRAGSDAGSQEYWWRDGAPLALVCPTITPAMVYELPKPITLHKGEHIELEFQVPWGHVTSASAYVFSNYQIGVSFCGYAAIKG
jgi:hypothetical protein